MPLRVQIVRHSPSVAATFVGLEGEVTFELTNNRLRLHDNITPGGFIVPNNAQVAVLISALDTTLTANIAVIDAAKMNRSVITAADQVVVGTAANTEAVIAMAASTILSRLASGVVKAATPAEIRTLLNVSITDAFLTSIGTLGTAADKLLKTTAIDTAAEISITSSGEAMIAAASTAAQRLLLDIKTQGETSTEIDADVAAGLVALIPTGTVMCFFQSAAPTGWTQVTTQNDKVFRVVSGTGGVAGGNWTITGVTVDNHVLTTAQMPAHTHSAPIKAGTALYGGGGFGTTQGSISITGSTGGGTSHPHGLTADGAWRPAYIDVILASKD